MKVEIKIIGILIMVAMSLFSCSNGRMGEASYESSNQKSMTSEASDSEEMEVERKLIKEGRISFETTDIEASRKQIYESIERHDAYTSSDDSYKSNGRISNTITIRVPAEKFDALLADVTKGVTKLDSKNITVKDVTEEFLDVQARLTTKKELEKRYLELLEKANTVAEILEVEKELGQLRSDIESIEGRLKYIENKVSFATLYLNFYEKIPHESAFGEEFKNGFQNGWNNLIWFFVFLVNIWPFILIIALLIYLIGVWRKRRKRK